MIRRNNQDTRTLDQQENDEFLYLWIDNHRRSVYGQENREKVPENFELHFQTCPDCKKSLEDHAQKCQIAGRVLKKISQVC